MTMYMAEINELKLELIRLLSEIDRKNVNHHAILINGGLSTLLKELRD